MPVLLVVPARVGSTRLPSKPLLPLGGAPLVARVIERVREVPGIDRLVLATDSQMIAEAVAPWGAEVVMTSAEHASGTDRIAEVAARAEFRQFDVIVNVQGDEPFIPMEAVTGAVARVLDGDPIGTAAAPLDPALRDDPARVKVVCDGRGRALYFSRSPIPHLRDRADLARTRWWQHLGVYAYRREPLLDITARPVTDLERSERLEQLRALDAGYVIGVAFLDAPADPGIDTPADLAAAELRWRELAEVSP
ncbi:MAG TPA: 3-deoxy-manno-octulosonate cytidylyltransferase [Gemmatimonadales bacterium]